MREFSILQHVFASNRGLPARVTIPPGDDMGAMRLTGRDVLVTVDQVADGVHFDLAKAPLEKVARKAITRNVSDVAAMAAKPIGSVVAAALPRTFGEERAGRLFDLMRDVAAQFDCPIFGGDVSIWDHPLLMSVTVLAEPWPGVAPVLRSGASPGDVVFVTGALGGSIETLADGYTHHLDFEPRVELARHLASNEATRPTAMIDVSDGLARDLLHICELSGVSAELVAGDLPASRGCTAAARKSGREAWSHVLSDGEDYELCFTIAAGRAAMLPKQVAGVPITRVGRIVERTSGRASVIARTPEGERRDVTDSGWEHHGT